MPNLPIKDPKLKAFTEMMEEDIEDALEHGLHPGHMVVALLLYAATLAMRDDSCVDAEDFMQYSAASWNDRAEKIDGATTIIPFKDDEDDEGLKS